MERHKRETDGAKMETGKEEKKTTIKTNKQENEKTRGNAELPHTAEEREKGKLASCLWDVGQKQTDLQDEQPDNDDIHEYPTFLNLIVQRYEGKTCEDQLHGEGVASFEGGHSYEGMFSKGLMDGRGVFTGADGLKYEGEFVCNMPMGKGTYTWPDGSSYKGEVYNGIRHGTGTYTWHGVSYTGQWDQAKRHGKGAVYYNQDRTSWYKGDWVRNTREGWGVRRYPSGNIYSGEWKNNLRHGEGTMRWLKLGQQYVGMWQNGVQHGRGTHVWVMRRADGSQYSQSNRYTGDFVQGQRHGPGTLYYASGAIYEEEWRRDEKHGKAKFTFEDGHVVEGEFVDDQMMAHILNGNNAPTALPGSSILRTDMPLNIERLLEKIPERKRGSELKQVEFVVLRHVAALRSVYSFYSRLGHAHSPDNTFLLSSLQFWRLLKDCNIHHHGITLMQMDHFIREDATPAEVHSPFTSILLHRLLSCLVIVAYHIYHKDVVSQNNLLAACFSKLMTDNILPNSKNVKGFLFRQPDCAVVAMSYSKKCWEVYQAYCKVNVTPGDDQTMTYHQLLWMFKDLHLLDTNLTTARLLQVITAESRDPGNLSACLDLEVGLKLTFIYLPFVVCLPIPLCITFVVVPLQITFLEFFEVLLGSAEVKCQRVSEGLEEGQSASSPDAEAMRDVPETGKSSDTADLSTAQDVLSQQDVKTEVTEKPQSAEQRRDEKGMLTRGTKVELWNQTIHQFFNHFFFPALEHNQLVSRNMEEDRRQEAQRLTALAERQVEGGHQEADE
ncbi:radial spoke head 10 homolog B isoform X1 [Anarrhichthys ocellatus]|uniref:radial spoke head 10 homolog B isoform X1 n=2 Tax=Anarrhichthys ocellatus TaxID=433405 RepID=UPI0012EE294F|nr:radial spoke head 10 homolog B2 isoform X1 [Anarrhichthys ocellatus]